MRQASESIGQDVVQGSGRSRDPSPKFAKSSGPSVKEFARWLAFGLVGGGIGILPLKYVQLVAGPNAAVITLLTASMLATAVTVNWGRIARLSRSIGRKFTPSVPTQRVSAINSVSQQLEVELDRDGTQTAVKVVYYLKSTRDFARFEEVYRSNLEGLAFDNLYRADPHKGSVIGGYLERRRRRSKPETNGAVPPDNAERDDDGLNVAQAAAVALAAIDDDGVAFTGPALAIREGGRSLIIRLTPAQRKYVEDNLILLSQPRKLLRELQKGSTAYAAVEIANEGRRSESTSASTPSESAPKAFNTDV